MSNPNLADRRGIFLLFAQQNPIMPVSYLQHQMLGTYVRVRWESRQR